MFANLNPEEQARVLIDSQLTAAGWVVQDRSAIDLVNHIGVAVREVILEKWAGRADYVLYLNRKMVGVIEAKPQGTTLMAVRWQSHRYATGLTGSQADGMAESETKYKESPANCKEGIIENALPVSWESQLRFRFRNFTNLNQCLS